MCTDRPILHSLQVQNMNNISVSHRTVKEGAIMDREVQRHNMEVAEKPVIFL